MISVVSRLANLLLDVTSEQRRRRAANPWPSQVFDTIVDISAFAGALLVLFMAVSIGLNVLLRRVFEAPLVWALPMTEFSLLYITFLAAPVVLRREGHVRMTAITEMLSERRKAWFYIAGSMIGAFVSAVLVWRTFESTFDQIQSGALLLQGIEIHKALVTWVIPYGFTLLGVQFLRQAVNALRTRRWGGAALSDMGGSTVQSEEGV